MRVVVTMSCIAIGVGVGVAFGISDTANATDEGDYQNSSAIEPKIKSDARIMGSDGRARTPTQHAYWVARHPKEQRSLADTISSPAAERHSFQSELCSAKLASTDFGSARQCEIESASQKSADR
jgi:hypothetical protein